MANVKTQKRPKTITHNSANHAKLDGLLNIVMQAFKNKNYSKAEKYLHRFKPQHLKHYPHQAHVYFYQGLLNQQQEKLPQAALYYRKAIQAKSDYVTAFNNLGNVLKNLNKDDEAKIVYEKAINLNPNYAEAYYNLGNLYFKQHNYPLAYKNYQQAIELHPQFIQVHFKIISTLLMLDNLTEAVAYQKKLFSSQLEQSEFYFQLGIIFQQQNHLIQAVECYQFALSQGAKLADLYVNMAAATHLLGASADKVIPLYQQAIALEPNNASIYVNMGYSLYRFLQFDQALTVLQKAIAINPNIAEAYYNIGMIKHDLNKYQDAMNFFKQALNVNHHYSSANAMLINAAQHCADWTVVSKYLPLLIEDLKTNINNHQPLNISPFGALMLPIGNELQLAVAKSTAKSHQPQQLQALPYAQKSAAKLRIGYLSADFSTRHPVGLLINNIFSFHDRQQFSIYGYGLRAFPAHEAQHIERSFDQFTLLASLDDSEAAQQINEDGIDILVDLGGLTKHTRPGILANRPAPIQCHFLGTTNTMGADYVDYYFATAMMVPKALQIYFTEKVVYLPKTFIATPPFAIPDKLLSRSDYGLPEDACVYCCFNTVQRIDQEVFSAWMTILKAVPKSVLWLQHENDTMVNNLRQYAQMHDVNSERLIFTPPEALTLNWRHRLADLWLDTFTLSGGTAGIICAYAGLPVLTLCGATPHSRTGAGVAAAAGMDELIVYSIEDYQQTAIALGTNLDRLKNLKATLLNSRDNLALFKPQAFIRDLEAIYLTLSQKTKNKI